MIEITATDAVNALGAVVADRGLDFIYEPPVAGSTTCFYAHDGAPSCGVGAALAVLQVPFDVIQSLDNANDFGLSADHKPVGTPIAARAMRAPLTAHNVNVTYQAAQVFEAFQTVQDSKQTYRRALDHALDTFRRITQEA